MRRRLEGVSGRRVCVGAFQCFAVLCSAVRHWPMTHGVECVSMCWCFLPFSVPSVVWCVRRPVGHLLCVLFFVADDTPAGTAPDRPLSPRSDDGGRVVSAAVGGRDSAKPPCLRAYKPYGNTGSWQCLEGRGWVYTAGVWAQPHSRQAGQRRGHRPANASSTPAAAAPAARYGARGAPGAVAAGAGADSVAELAAKDVVRRRRGRRVRKPGLPAWGHGDRLSDADLEELLQSARSSRVDDVP